jgi:hypothetical protein
MREEKIGVIGHVWKRAGTASVDLVGGSLRVGDRIRIRGHGHDVEQVVESLEADHVAAEEGRQGQLVAVAVSAVVHAGDEVFRMRG